MGWAAPPTLPGGANGGVGGLALVSGVCVSVQNRPRKGDNCCLLEAGSWRGQPPIPSAPGLGPLSCCNSPFIAVAPPGPVCFWVAVPCPLSGCEGLPTPCDPSLRGCVSTVPSPGRWLQVFLPSPPALGAGNGHGDHMPPLGPWDGSGATPAAAEPEGHRDQPHWGGVGLGRRYWAVLEQALL